MPDLRGQRGGSLTPLRGLTISVTSWERWYAEDGGTVVANQPACEAVTVGNKMVSHGPMRPMTTGQARRDPGITGCFSAPAQATDWFVSCAGRGTRAAFAAPPVSTFQVNRLGVERPRPDVR